jgi:hypothetical protein
MVPCAALCPTRAPTSGLQLVERSELLLQQQQERSGMLYRDTKASSGSFVILEFATHHQRVDVDLDQTLVVLEGLQALQFDIVGFHRRFSVWGAPSHCPSQASTCGLQWSSCAGPRRHGRGAAADRAGLPQRQKWCGVNYLQRGRGVAHGLTWLGFRVRKLALDSAIRD